jgi:hypothetical protein
MQHIMKLRALETAILLGCVRDLVRLKGDTTPDGLIDWKLRDEVADAREHGYVRCRALDWCHGSLPNTMSAPRAYEALESAGLVQRVYSGRATRHLAPTEEGIRVANEIEREAAAPAATEQPAEAADV